MSERDSDNLKWHEGISGYQWLVLAVCSAGWLFDVFEGQIFVASMRDSLPQLLGGVPADAPEVKLWADRSFAFFLVGGALGGIFFGWLADRIGRSRTMIFTILFYSLFTGVTALATQPWHMVALRFLVAIGVGGEWAVASAMVAEVMPRRSRPIMGSIFHASSIFGALLAAATGYLLASKPWGDATWKMGFLVGLIPAFLILIIRWKMHEPEVWREARQSRPTGQFLALFHRENLPATVIGFSLASIGLTTFWGCHIYGKDALLRHAQNESRRSEGLNDSASKAQIQAAYKKHGEKIKKAEMRSMALNSIGGGLGLVLFGGISKRIGRRWTFVFYHLGAAAIVAAMFLWLIPKGASVLELAVALPVFGFLTLGMHAGYAIYFPELFHTALRGTGTGFCFNAGRLVSAGYFFFLSPLLGEKAVLWMIPVFVAGAGIALLGRETRDAELPE